MSAEDDKPKKCAACKGRGRWQVREKYSDGTTSLVWYECGTCKGRGIIYAEDDEPEGTFDIGEMEDDDE